MEDGKPNETNENVTTPSTPAAPAAANKMSAVSNKMMSNARQLSKGSLGGLGDPKSRMASTVMSAMGKKTAQNSDANTNTNNTKPNPPTTNPNPSKSPTAGPPNPSKSPTGPTKPSPAAAGPSGITNNGTTSKKEEAIVEPKPSTSRKRHDSQGIIIILTK